MNKETKTEARTMATQEPLVGSTKPTIHYHYQVSYESDGVRKLDKTPWTTQALAQSACVRYFQEDEHPIVVRVDATESCCESTHWMD